MAELSLPCPDCGKCNECGTIWCGKGGCPICPSASVNDGDPFAPECWICGHPHNHWGVPHSAAMGDGLTRFDIVAHLAWRGVTWREGSHG